VIAEKKKKSEILNAILLNNYIRWKDYAKSIKVQVKTHEDFLIRATA